MNNRSRFRRGNWLLIRDTYQATTTVLRKFTDALNVARNTGRETYLWIFWWSAIKLLQYKLQHLSDWHLTVRYMCHLSRVSCPKQLTIGPTSIAWYSTIQHTYHAAFPRTVYSRDVQIALNGTCCICGTSIIWLTILLRTLRTGSFKWFKRPLPGFLTILIL